MYVHSSHLVDTRVLKKGDRVRFRTVREGDKVSAHSVEKILAQDEPAETTEGQGVSPRSAKESGSWRREKPKLAGKLRQKNALLLQIDTCTVKPYTGDKVSVVLIPEAISFDHAWVNYYDHDQNTCCANLYRSSIIMSTFLINSNFNPRFLRLQLKWAT